MQVTAVLTPDQPNWRWRIVNDAGEVIEESQDCFQNIGEAVAAGGKRLAKMEAADRSEPLTRTGSRWKTRRRS